MFGQTFQFGDFATVGALIVLEGLLSADNALVLAIMVRHLPRKQQQKALLYGLGGAFVFRLIAILFASVVLQQWWLQAIGAGYLLFLPIKHFIHAAQSEGPHAKPVGGSFWKTVFAVEMADIAFAVDSVLAGIGFITTKQGVMQEKIWVVYLGAIIGIVLLRFAAGAFIRVLEKFPLLDHVAYILVGWVGVKLAFHAVHKLQDVSPGSVPFALPYMTQTVFWVGLALIAVLGTTLAYVKRKPEADSLEEEAQIAADVKDLSIDEP